MSMNAVSAAIHISSIPWNGPIGAVRVGMIDGAFVVNPTVSQRKASSLDLVVAGTTDAITMVEAGAEQISEAKMVDALMLAHSEIQKIVAGIEELRGKAGKPKMDHQLPEENPWVAKLLSDHRDEIFAALDNRIKHERGAAVSECKAKLVAELGGDDEEQTAQVKAAFGDAKDVVFREMILDGKRVDGRDTKTVRPIVCDLDVIPRAHGSALFTRGETQGLITCTLGTQEDELMIDSLGPKAFDRFMLHYNFLASQLANVVVVQVLVVVKLVMVPWLVAR